MEPLFLDTNILVRAFADDTPPMPEIARGILTRVESGELQVHITESVLVEAVQVLSSRRLYNLPKRQVADALSAVLSFRTLRLSHKPMYQRALDLWVEHSVDFVDALSVAFMNQAAISTIVSFDHDFNRFPGIARTVDV